MQFTSHTQIIFADSAEEARQAYVAKGIQPDKDPKATLEVIHVASEEDFDIDSPFNFAGEVSLSPEFMDIVRKDADRAYVCYYLEDSDQ